MNVTSTSRTSWPASRTAPGGAGPSQSSGRTGVSSGRCWPGRALVDRRRGGVLGEPAGLAVLGAEVRRGRRAVQRPAALVAAGRLAVGSDGWVDGGACGVCGGGHGPLPVEQRRLRGGLGDSGSSHFAVASLDEPSWRVK